MLKDLPVHDRQVAAAGLHYAVNAIAEREAKHSPKSVTWRELHSLRVHLEQQAAQLTKESL